jgi:integrase
MTRRLRVTLENRRKDVDGEYVFPGRFGGHKTINNNRAFEAVIDRAGLDDVISHNLRKTFATRLLSRGAAITDVQHLLGHSSVKTTERSYAAFVRNECFKQTIDLLDEPKQPELKVVKRWLPGFSS